MTEILKEEERYTLFTSSSGTEALEIVGKENIHIILLDIVMPGMDGYEVCKMVRRDFSQAPIQIVLISGYEKNSSLEDLLELGADDFIGKPIATLELRARVKAAFIRWRNQVKLIDANQGESGLEAGGLQAGLNPQRRNLMVENRRLRNEFDRIRRVNRDLKKDNKELLLLASLDTLTGLLNRRTLLEQIDVEIERSLRIGLPLTGIMIDIDHFKRVNDNFGHPCGDQVLKDIGRRLTQNLRKYDYAGRYGGEEFYVIFPNATAEVAMKISERFRLEMEEADYACDNQPFQVTISVGVAQYNPGETAVKWISRADRAMYIAKNQGRNKVLLK